jgi:ribosome-associated toxin RatA of RatAB toxin-antitoxin module
MNTTNRLQIASPFERLFSLAADIARWPEFLPHYRWVKILSRDGEKIRAEMAARHRGVPLWWRTIQQSKFEEKRIEFTHVGGITRGMTVQWTFDETGESCGGPVWLVQIHHQFEPAWGPFKSLVADRLIGKMFVTEVANKTLKKIKSIVESRP